MTEIWKDIVGYEGLYQVSNLGRIKSLDTYDRLGRFREGRVLKDADNGNGYRVVNLKHDGQQNMRTVHRLVAEAFLVNENDNPEVNHKDGNKANNRIDNLEWCSSEYNNDHAERSGLRHCCHKKAVRCVETGEIFDSTVAAGKSIPLKSGSSGISTACRKYRGRITFGGYHWEYV